MKAETSITKTSCASTMAGHLRSVGAARLLLWLLLLGLPAVVQAQFTFTTNNGSITITGYTGTNGTVVIPGSINGYPVTSIGNGAFSVFSLVAGLTSVTIPDSVTNIGLDAFYGCQGLTSVTIPDGVTSIGEYAFAYCKSLTGITIPGSVTSIGDYAFYDCDRLANLTIGTGVTSIGDCVFYYCNLASVTLPNSVTSIGSNAFASSSLTSIAIPNSVTNIGDGAFEDCYYLTSVTIPDSITGIRNEAFAGTGLTNISIPDSVTSIGYGAFAGCTSLTSVTIPDSITSISWYAFFSCSRLTNVTIPDSVTNIDWFAFGLCTSLTSITIPDSVTSIGESPFEFCRSLLSVTIPDSVTSIGEDAFACCTNLASVTLGTNVTDIGPAAFWDCLHLTSVTIPDSVVSIGGDAFFHCDSLTSITIPNSVTSIEGDAFDYCTSLLSVTIPDSVTNIGDHAFEYCDRLTNVFFTGNVPASLGDYIFNGDTNVTVYAVLGTTGWSSTFAGEPVVMVSDILWPPQSQTAEIGATVDFTPDVAEYPAVTCLWFFNGTNLLSRGTNSCLELTNVDAAMDGTYTLVVTNDYGSTSSPAMLNVIPVVARRPVPAVQVSGEAGSLLNVDYVNSLKPAPSWTTLGSVSLASASQFYFDLSVPLAPQRFYRASQSGASAVVPSLNLPGLVPAITLTGNVGDSLRLDCINQIGPTNAWVTLGTVTLTNTSQLYFDVSALGQPPRLYRIVPLP